MIEQMATENVEIRREGHKLVIEIDLTQTIGTSHSGKTEMIATTRGLYIHKETGTRVNLNVWRRPYFHFLKDLDEGPYRAVLLEALRSEQA